MFNTAISTKSAPKYLSSDNDPLFLYHQWQANLRVLSIDEIKTIPYTPISHPFIERLIGTIRHEYLDHTLFWNAQDLERKLANFRQYHNRDRVARRRYASCRLWRSSASTRKTQKLFMGIILQWSLSNTDCRMNRNSPRTGKIQ